MTTALYRTLDHVELLIPEIREPLLQALDNCIHGMEPEAFIAALPNLPDSVRLELAALLNRATEPAQKDEGCPLCGCPIGRHPLRDPHKKYEALMAAAEALAKHRCYSPGRQVIEALATLRAAGIKIEERREP